MDRGIFDSEIFKGIIEFFEVFFAFAENERVVAWVIINLTFHPVLFVFGSRSRPRVFSISILPSPRIAVFTLNPFFVSIVFISFVESSAVDLSL